MLFILHDAPAMLSTLGPGSRHCNTLGDNGTDQRLLSIRESSPTRECCAVASSRGRSTEVILHQRNGVPDGRHVHIEVLSVVVPHIAENGPDPSR